MRKVPSPPGAALAIFFILSLAAPTAWAANDDPLETVNRGTHEFNRVIDKLLFRPLAATYVTITPKFVRTGVNNFFSNLDDVRVGLNHLAQLELNDAANDFGRLLLNSTVGVGGLIDVADTVGLEKNREDFGKTLAHYGVDSGPYVVLPFFGPSTLRDAFGLGVDSLAEPLRQLDHVPSRNSLAGTEAVDYRSNLLLFDDLVIGDSYLFLKDAYLQQREYVVNGEYPDLAFEDF
ncbi:MAG: VacJ family lipoprotein [Pseudomonadales bacterium]|nr:VacJ family lipoprotein [Pseudomonadales bacterium]